MQASAKVSINSSTTRLGNVVVCFMIKNLWKFKGEIPSESSKYNHLSVGPLSTFSEYFIKMKSYIGPGNTDLKKKKKHQKNTKKIRLQ